jgi:hypothetical protein
MTPRKKKKIEEIPPLKVEVIRPKLKEKFEFAPLKEKIMVLTKIPLPEGHVRVIVIQSFAGMIDNLMVGDIIDIPERRYKSLSFRGLVRKYDGDLQPNKQR